MGRGEGQRGLPENIINVKHKSCRIAIKETSSHCNSNYTALNRSLSLSCQCSFSHSHTCSLLHLSCSPLLSLHPYDMFLPFSKNTHQGRASLSATLLNSDPQSSSWLWLAGLGEPWSGIQKPPTNVHRHTHARTHTTHKHKHMLRKLKHLSGVQIVK